MEALYQIEFTSDSFLDLDHFIEFSGNSESAVRFAFNLIEMTEILKKFPRLGRKVIERKGVRKLVEDPFVIYYHVSDRQRRILILRYWHGSQEGIPYLKGLKNL